MKTTMRRGFLTIGLVRLLTIIGATAESNHILAAADPASNHAWRTFELRAVSTNKLANGETDFKGETAVFSTDERIVFLNTFADFASRWFGDTNLDSLAVSPGQTAAALAKIKPQPDTLIRRTLRLSDGWKRSATGGSTNLLPAPCRAASGAAVRDGSLRLPSGRHDILKLNQSTGWRYEISWKARVESHDELHLSLDGSSNAIAVKLPTDRWTEFRWQADLAGKHGHLSLDGKRIASPEIENTPEHFSVTTREPLLLDDLRFVDFVTTTNVRVPFKPVVIVQDHFDDPVKMDGWTDRAYDDSHWADAGLPCAHGGFSEAGEELCLRRTFDAPPFKRAWLEVETLDPSGEIYLNGALAASIPNRSPVFLDVTSLLRAGTNLLALKVNHRSVTNLSGHAPADAAIGWFAGRTKLHLLQSDIAIRELRAHTESIDTSGKAEQITRILLTNATDQLFDGTVRVSYRPWFPAENAASTGARLAARVPPHGSYEIISPLAMPKAALWTPEQPSLYSVHVALTDRAGRVLDDDVITTGIRTVSQRDGDFLLNGKPAMLNGAQIMGWRPYPDFQAVAKFNRCAPADRLIAEMLAIKNMGGNLLRVHAHAASDTPDGINDPRIAEFADQLGLALMWAGPTWLREGDERRMNLDGLGDYIRQVYNHPSIVIWEMSNHPNKFKDDDSPERTHEFVRRMVNAVLPHDTSRLISPTTFWQHTHYSNDLGTIDFKGRAITPVPEYTHPLVTRGTQDALTGYGAEWSKLRRWPQGLAADCLSNHIRAWFNFEHEESAAQPNWNLSAGWPWHRLRSYEADYEKNSIGRVLDFNEWRASQAWQAFSAYESMRKQIFHGVSGFSWCTIEGGANSGTYEKPLTDPFGHAKLAWHIHKLVFQPVLAGSDNVDVVYGPDDKIAPCIFNLGTARKVDLIVTIKTPAGGILDERIFPNLQLAAGRSLLKLPPFTPKLPGGGFVVVEYAVTPLK